MYVYILALIFRNRIISFQRISLFVYLSGFLVSSTSESNSLNKNRSLVESVFSWRFMDFLECCKKKCAKKKHLKVQCTFYSSPRAMGLLTWCSISLSESFSMWTCTSQIRWHDHCSSDCQWFSHSHHRALFQHGWHCGVVFWLYSFF